MDAALKRNRPEEPAELPPSARDLEEEEDEEEGMEQGLEEEEEVDPRIQVGLAGGGGAAEAGIRTYTRLAAPSACGPGGGGHVGPGARREGPGFQFHRVHGEVAVPAWMRPDYSGEPPQIPGRIWGSP